MIVQKRKRNLQRNVQHVERKRVRLKGGFLAGSLIYSATLLPTWATPLLFIIIIIIIIVIIIMVVISFGVIG